MINVFKIMEDQIDALSRFLYRNDIELTDEQFDEAFYYLENFCFIDYDDDNFPIYDFNKLREFIDNLRKEEL